ncbi:MAG: sigma-70 family RNA polymerase sigma factor [Myxococcota bacterium]
MRESLEAEIRACCDERDWTRAVTVAIRGYGPEILGYLAAVTDREADATEAFSLFCERAWRGIQQFRWDSSFRTWAYVIARNELWRHLRGERRRGRREMSLAEVPAVEEILDRVRTETAAFLRTAVKDRFAALRAELKPIDRDILVLRVDRRLPWTDVAQILAESRSSLESSPEVMTPASLRKRLERIKKQLRLLAIDRGLLDQAGNVVL